MEYFSFILPLFLVIWVIALSITTFLHEIGHAIPALIFTRAPVNMYLGSYGDKQSSKKVQVSKRFTIYFKNNILKWRSGMVEHYATDLSVFKRLIITALGPLMSLIIAIAALYIAFSFNFHGAVKLGIAIFSFSALYDLKNIYPNSTPIITDNGTITHQDGYRIMLLLKNKNSYTLLKKAYKLYAEENYIEAVKTFEKIRPEHINETNLPYIIEACRQLKLYLKAKQFYTPVLNQPAINLSTDIWCQIGVIESLLGEHEIALGYYNNSLMLDEANTTSLCNRGFTSIVLEQYIDAIRDFNIAIKIQPDYAYAWANKGYAKIKLDLLADGLTDIKYAIAVNEKEAYAYRALGLYYFETKEYHKALETLRFACNIDADIYMINEEIKMAESKLSAITQN